MKAIAILTLVLSLSSLADARVGETLDECSYRYGSSVGHYAKDQVRFNRGHIYITVHVGIISRSAKILVRRLAERFQMPRYTRF